MKVGCFALIEPFSSLDHQLQIIEDMGFKFADVTDSHSGGSLIDTIGMTASVSLDSNPIALKKIIRKTWYNCNHCLRACQIIGSVKSIQIWCK